MNKRKACYVVEPTNSKCILRVTTTKKCVALNSKDAGGATNSSEREKEIPPDTTTNSNEGRMDEYTVLFPDSRIFFCFHG